MDRAKNGGGEDQAPEQPLAGGVALLGEHEEDVAFLNWEQGGEYTCLLFKGMRRGKFSTNDTRNNALFLIETMKSKEFEFLFDNMEFNLIKNQIEPLAKHW